MEKYSLVFGKYREVTGIEEEFLQKIIKESPVRMFQLVNKALNDRGYCCNIERFLKEGD